MTNLFAVTNEYGATEIAPVEKSMQDEFLQNIERVSWDDPRLGRIVRFRILTDPGFPAWDISYVWGRLKDGTPVDVELPFHQMPKRWKGFLIKEAKEAGVYAKGLGFFEAMSTVY